LALQLTAINKTVIFIHPQAIARQCASLGVYRAPVGWRVTAQAPDGVIEALEHEHHTWAIALQWHPEMSLGDALQQQIFQAFVDAAVARKVVRSRA
jgi:gamma-glutamyl-gamma-aminobutyrate hydrolase PuuD